MISGPTSAVCLVATCPVADNRVVLTRRTRRTTGLATLAGGAVLAVLLGAGGSSAAGLRGAPTHRASAATSPTAVTVTIEDTPNGMFAFSPSTVTLAKGGQLTLVNDSFSAHTLTSRALDSDGHPLFNVHVEPHATKQVPVSTLGGGTYAYFCQIHPSMTGNLVIDGPPDGQVSDVPRFRQPLVQPPRLTGSHLVIPMRKALVRVLPRGPRTPMWTFGGTFPGPTIVRRAGQDTHVTFVNHLPRKVGSVTIHQHGGHQASRYDGQPDRFLIRHGHRRTYDYPLVDAGKPVPAALRFYHDHKMNRTARDNWFGLQGMFLTTDPQDAKRGLPHGHYDVPLMVTDRSFTRRNRLTNPFRHSSMSMRTPSPALSGVPAHTMVSDPGTATVGSQVLVNGRFAPYLRVRAGLYRLQILNASLFSSYDFALSDGRPFEQIGTGSGLLPRPVTRTDILLGPAQRADVVVDFRHESHRHVLLSSIPRSDGSTTGIGTREAALMQFRVGGTTHQRAHVPHRLAHIPRLVTPRRVAMTWTLGVSKDSHGSFWSINGKRFDPTRVDHRVPLGSTEKWKIRNTTDMTHYIHLHEEEWRTVLRDGRRPPPWERGYEDTWRLDPGESIVVAARFTDYTGRFMIHCHMLDHEDDGMMATFRVVRKH
jgi:spore coat protein A